MHSPFNSKHKISKLLIVILMICGLLFLYGCAAAAKTEVMSRDAAEEMEMPAAMAPMEAPMADEGMYSEFSGGSVNTQEVKRIVLKNVSLSIVVDDPAKTMDVISMLAEELDGFVVSANLSKYTLENNVEVPHASITIRVPAESLTEAIDAIESQSEQEPLSKTINSQDVTSEYTDLQSRLRNLESAEEQLRKIMAEAVRTEDVLTVYNKLVDVREQIEVVKGQIQYYEQASSLSAISVEILANEAVQPLTIGGWQPVGVAKSAIQALINTLKVIVNIVIWLVIFVLPILLVFFVVFILPLNIVIRYWKRRRANKKAAAAKLVDPNSGETPSNQAK